VRSRAVMVIRVSEYKASDVVRGPGPNTRHPLSVLSPGSPKFLGNLNCPSARVLTDAGRTAHTRPFWCSSVAPGPPGAKAPTKGLSTPNSMAFRLAVYASPGSLPHHDARLASGCWSGSTGWAFHPQDSDERFQDCILTFLSSSPKLCLAQWGQPQQTSDCGSRHRPRSPQRALSASGRFVLSHLRPQSGKANHLVPPFREHSRPLLPNALLQRRRQPLRDLRQSLSARR